MSVINDADLKNKANTEYNNNKESYVTTAVLGVSSGIFLTFGIFGLSGVLEFLPIADTAMVVPIFCVALAVASAIGGVFSYSSTTDENTKLEKDIFKKYKEIEDEKIKEAEKQKRVSRLIDIDNVKTPKQQKVLNLVAETDLGLKQYINNKKYKAREAKKVLTEVRENLENDNNIDNSQTI